MTDDTHAASWWKAVRWLCVIAVFSCVVLAVCIVLWPRPGTPGFTGAAVTVPACPADAAGCRLYVVRVSDGGAAGQRDWSGTGSTLNVVLPTGRYAISAEGCAGDGIESRAISVTAGFHSAVNLGGLWELVGSVGRSCPGSIPTTSG